MHSELKASHVSIVFIHYGSNKLLD